MVVTSYAPSPRFMHELNDLRGRSNWSIMLPEARHRPTGISKCLGVAIVSRLVASDLASPVVAMGMWQMVMLRATVPEASVN